MITTVINAGTGNQLFQYAVAKSLAKDLNADMYINILEYTSFFFITNRKKHERYNLGHFNIKENFISSYDKNNLFFLFNLIASKLNIQLNFKMKFIREKNLFKNFDTFKEISSIINNFSNTDNVYLTGFFMDERYFIHNENIIREDFKIITPPSEENKEIIKKISSQNAVALCVRRGDYLNPFWKAQSGFCTLNYYNEAIDLISKKVDNPIFYIFSDDPQWVKENIKLNYPTNYMDHNGVDEDYEDLRLMSLCKHFIIGNSSFHWWGAWLSDNKNKFVITPNPWHKSYTLPDIVPSNWIKLKCDHSDLFEEGSDILYNINEDILLEKKQKFKINSIGSLSGMEDNILKIVINATSRGFIIIKNNLTKPIFIGYFKGISIRYIYLDKKIRLNSLIIDNNGDDSIIIENIIIKSI